MTRLLRLLLAALLTVPVLVTSAAPASACSCAPATRAGYAASADAVVVATLLDDLPEGDTGSVTAAASVEHVYKGSFDDAEITIATGAQSSACGLTGLLAGQTWLFYGGRDGDVVSVDLCGGSTGATARERARVERILGSGSPVAAEQRPSSGDARQGAAGTPVPAWTWLMGGGAMLVGGSVAGVLLRRRLVRR